MLAYHHAEDGGHDGHQFAESRHRKLVPEPNQAHGDDAPPKRARDGLHACRDWSGGGGGFHCGHAPPRPRTRESEYNAGSKPDLEHARLPGIGVHVHLLTLVPDGVEPLEVVHQR